MGEFFIDFISYAINLFANLFGVNGIWMGIPSGWLIGGIITYIYYKKDSWKSKCVVSFDDISLDNN